MGHPQKNHESMSWLCCMGKTHKRQRNIRRQEAGIRVVLQQNYYYGASSLGDNESYYIMAAAGNYTASMINDQLFTTLWNGKFYKIHEVNALCNALLRIDYSVVSSRRDGHNMILDFMNAGLPASHIFDEGQRFVFRNRADVYVSDTDSNFYNLIIGLASVLSYRETNTAKDTKAANAAVQQPAERVTIGVDQGLQDNSKKFEELQKQLKVYSRAGDHTWDRATFESKVAHWVVPLQQLGDAGAHA